MSRTPRVPGTKRRRLLLFLACILAAACPAVPALAAIDPAIPSDYQATHTTAGDPTVAAVFLAGAYLGHQCTASVVTTARRDVLIGAAHCFQGTGQSALVAPGYVNGKTPYGLWKVTEVYADPAWIDHQDPHRDWVFLVVSPRVINGRTVHIQDITGSNLLLPHLPPHQRVTVPAYPAGIFDAPITCSTRAYRWQGYPAFDCAGYRSGTSGAPWLVPTSRGWAVAGVIGGLHQGGCLPTTSYSSELGAPALTALARADHDDPPDSLPAADPDGC